MLTMDEILGEQHWILRSDLEDADDDRLHRLLDDGPGLRRLLPSLICIDEAKGVIEEILNDRARKRVEAEAKEADRLARLEKARLAKAAKPKVPRKKAAPKGVDADPTPPIAPIEPPLSHDPPQGRSVRWADMLYNFFGGK